MKLNESTDANVVQANWATSNFNATNGTRNRIVLNNQNEILIIKNVIKIGTIIRCIQVEHLTAAYKINF